MIYADLASLNFLMSSLRRLTAKFKSLDSSGGSSTPLLRASVAILNMSSASLRFLGLCSDFILKSFLLSS